MEGIFSFFEVNEDVQVQLVRSYYDQENYIKGLEVIEDLVLTLGREKLSPALHFLQGAIFSALAGDSKNSDVKIAFSLGSVECFYEDCGVPGLSAFAFLDLAKQLDSAFYYKKAVKIAKESLSHMPETPIRGALETVVESAESKIRLGVPVKNSDTKVREFKDDLDKIRSDPHTSAGKSLRSSWAGLDVEKKRNFMKVNTTKLSSYVGRVYGSEGKDVLEQVLDFAKTNRKWKFWICRSCSQKFLYLKKFKNHLEQQHAAKFKPYTTEHMAQKVDEVWACMISVVGWEPVDSVAAAEMIKTQLESVEVFTYENGWSIDWPLTVDEERSKLLTEIQLLLLNLWEHKILSWSIRDWIMQFLVRHLAQFEVSEHTIRTDYRLAVTPQSICFLECHDLNQILDILKKIKCKRDDGIDRVHSVVDSLCGRTRVKEKIELDNEFSFMLMDRRLLRSKIASFDDEGTIDVCDHNLRYAKTHPQGDDIITWLLDYPLLEESFEFPRSIRAYNREIWLAVLRVIHFTCRTLGIKYAKKTMILDYDATLVDAKNLCRTEDKRRLNTPEDQWNLYASLLCDKCEDVGDPYTRRLFLSAVRDVLEGASDPTFEFPDFKDCLKIIHGHKSVSDDKVLKSIDLLRLVIKNKVVLVDSKILLVENSRKDLLNDLTRLSNFDYRAYILPLLKRFLREELVGIANIEAKAKAAAAEADLLSEKKQEKAKKPGSKKKKKKSNKRTSTSVCSLLDRNVEHESSVNLELGVASSTLKMVEEDSMEPEDTVSSRRGQLEISSNTDKQEDAAKDIDKMSGEYSEQLEMALEESAVRCSLALDMTLKALCNTKVLKEYLVHNRHQLPDNLEEQVPCALRNFFVAFVSKQIKEEGVYIHLRCDLLASLDAVQFMLRAEDKLISMSSDDAELLVSILESLHCWKIPERESLVSHLFTLGLYERMSCRKCRRKTNYPEQSSYGIVLAADSIRDLKCAFENMEFEEILKVIRMEDEMLCDTKTGGCGKANFVHHIMRRCPPIFIIVMEWEKNETEKEIYETTKVLKWEIEISRLYEGLEETNRKYRLVSMVGCGVEEEYICLAYKKNRWFSFRHEALVKEAVGTWKNVVRFCGERKIRPEILFYEAFQWPNK